MGGPDRGADRGRAELAGREGERDVAPRHLRDAVLGGEAREGGVVQPHDHRAVHQADPGGDGAGAPDRPRHPLGALPVPRMRQALADDARLERHHRTARGDRERDLVGHEERHAGSRAGQFSVLAATSAPAWHAAASAAAASSPRARPARSTPSNASPAPVGSTSRIASARLVVNDPVDAERRPRLPVLHGRHRVTLPQGSRRVGPGQPDERLRLVVVGQHERRGRGLLDEPLGPPAFDERPRGRLDRHDRCVGPRERRDGDVVARVLQQQVPGDEERARGQRRREVRRGERRVRAPVGHHRAVALLDDDEHHAAHLGVTGDPPDVDAAVGERPEQQVPHEVVPDRRHHPRRRAGPRRPHRRVRRRAAGPDRDPPVHVAAVRERSGAGVHVEHHVAEAEHVGRHAPHATAAPRAFTPRRARTPSRGRTSSSRSSSC